MNLITEPSLLVQANVSFITYNQLDFFYAIGTSLEVLHSDICYWSLKNSKKTSLFIKKIPHLGWQGLWLYTDGRGYGSILNIHLDHPPGVIPKSAHLRNIKIKQWKARIILIFLWPAHYFLNFFF